MYIQSSNEVRHAENTFCFMAVHDAFLIWDSWSFKPFWFLQIFIFLGVWLVGKNLVHQILFMYATFPATNVSMRISRHQRMLIKRQATSAKQILRNLIEICLLWQVTRFYHKMYKPIEIVNGHIQNNSCVRSLLKILLLADL